VAVTIHRFGSVSSTQDEARRLLEVGGVRADHVVVADEQTAGRGRFGRSWMSAHGGLYATFVRRATPVVAVRAGVAVLRALARFEIEAKLKWPNDVVLGERKLAGLLIETIGDHDLIGIGVNLAEAPLATATSVEASGRDVRRGELVVAIAEELQRRADSGGLLAAYRENLATLGRPVCVTMQDGRTAEGTAVDVDDVGRLTVETADGVRTISSGECVHLGC